jgi:hypothetical protein
MPQAPGLKLSLKRGALVAAANWPLIAVQFIAESTLKLLLGVPVVGGIVLVVLLLDGDVAELLSGDVSDIVTRVTRALAASPLAGIAFLVAFFLVLVLGSALTFVIKGGTIAILAEAESHAGPIERPPVRFQSLRRANRTHIDPFLDACRRFRNRYIRLGMCLVIVYVVTASIWLFVVVGGLRLVSNIGVLLGWSLATVAVSCALIVWLSIVNLFYLLTQMVIAVDDVSVRSAAGYVVRFLRAQLREVAGVFGVVLVLVLIATVASILGTAGLYMISYVPFIALAVMPLQVAAWLVRGFVFQHLALTALSAYLTQYRFYRIGPQLAAVPGQRLA